MTIKISHGVYHAEIMTNEGLNWIEETFPTHFIRLLKI